VNVIPAIVLSVIVSRVVFSVVIGFVSLRRSGIYFCDPQRSPLRQDVRSNLGLFGHDAESPMAKPGLQISLSDPRNLDGANAPSYPNLFGAQPECRDETLDYVRGLVLHLLWYTCAP